jgi:hypothetical protein
MAIAAVMMTIAVVTVLFAGSISGNPSYIGLP